jgi:hypothetical protein
MKSKAERPPRRLLTYAMLKAAGPCKTQLRRFRRIFGDRLYVTEEIARMAQSKFDVGFLVWGDVGGELTPSAKRFLSRLMKKADERKDATNKATDEQTENPVQRAYGYDVARREWYEDQAAAYALAWIHDRKRR